MVGAPGTSCPPLCCALVLCGCHGGGPQAPDAPAMHTPSVPCAALMGTFCTVLCNTTAFAHVMLPAGREQNSGACEWQACPALGVQVHGFSCGLHGPGHDAAWCASHAHTCRAMQPASCPDMQQVCDCVCCSRRGCLMQPYLHCLMHCTAQTLSVAAGTVYGPRCWCLCNRQRRVCMIAVPGT